jgi:hypothetical protein
MAAIAHDEDLRSCERCGRRAKPESFWTLAVTVPTDGRVERDICVVCAAEVRRVLLSDPRRPGDATVFEGVAGRRQRRAAAALVRGTMYVSIAVTFFVLATSFVAR